MRAWVLVVILSTGFTVDGQNQITSFAPTPAQHWKVHQRNLQATDSVATIRLPKPKGGYTDFWLQPSRILPSNLQKKYPGLRAFAGYSTENPSMLVRLEVRPAGIFWQMDSLGIRTAGKWLASRDTVEWEQTPMLAHAGFSCHSPNNLPSTAQSRSWRSQTRELWTLRLALSTSFSFTQYHGGTKSGTLAALLTIVNRLNMVFERDLGIRFVLPEKQDTLIITSSEEFVFTVGREDLDNQEFIDDRLGNEAYDVGHVLDLGPAGGFAFLGAACSSRHKAKGYTSGPRGEGDLLVIDFLAHEIGHQLDATHSFNGLNGACRFGFTPGTAVEPGSGSSIMAYAGLCANDNVALASDPYFHAVSIQQIGAFTQFQIQQGCGESTPFDHEPPVISNLPDRTVIPIATPFTLTARVTDPERSERLLYSWEQVDSGPQQSISEVAGSGPAFRFRPPDTTAQQTFPPMSSLLSGTLQPGDQFLQVARPLNFQFLVRDPQPGGAHRVMEQVVVEVTDQAGPFTVQGGTDTVRWPAGSVVPVYWQVAGTDQSPINAQSVDIRLSTDGGFNYDILLAQEIPNTGQALVEIPPVSCAAGCRLQVRGHDQLFFALSPYPIQILEEAGKPLSVGGILEGTRFCQSDTFRLAMRVGGTAVLDEPVAWTAEPTAGIVLEQSAGLLQPGVTLPLRGWFAPINGPTELPMTFVVEQGGWRDTLFLSLQRDAPIVERPVAIGPDHLGDPLDPIGTVFSWRSLPGVDRYRFVLYQGTDSVGVWSTPDTIFQPLRELEAGTRYSWVVQGVNETCGPGPTTQLRSFETRVWDCDTFRQVGPFEFGAVPFTRVEIPVNQSAPITDANVLAIDGFYPGPDDLEFRLRSPQGPAVDLLQRTTDCAGSGRFSFQFDDRRIGPVNGCLSSTLRPFQSQEAMANWQGQSPQGIWQLFVFHRSNSGGQIDSVTLEICREPDMVFTQQAILAHPLRLFPNPATDQVLVDLPPMNSQTGWLVATDRSGRVKMRKAVTGDQAELSIGHWPAGWYVLSLSIPGTGVVYQSRLIVQP